MMLKLEKKVANFLPATGVPSSKNKILLAVSGGADSTALMHVMYTLRSQDSFAPGLHCAHINHQLRNDANSDEEFVISQARKLEIPLTIKRIDVRTFSEANKLSIETAARQLRIQSLTEIARANECGCIATGHQKNDNAETIIHRLLRGTGFRGLAGIWPRRESDENVSFARPLLCVTRDEIIRYLEQKNLKWREDYTNKDYSYTRNHIRHRLLPVLQEDCEGSLVEQFSKLSISANRLYKSICSHADDLWQKAAKCGDERAVLDLEFFFGQFPPVKLELIRRSLSHIGCGEAQLTSRHYEDILRLTQRDSTKNKIQLPGGFVVLREDGNLVFTRWASQAPLFSYPSRFTNGGVGPHPTILKIPGATKFNQYTIQASIFEKEQVDFKKFLKTKTPSIEWFDLDKMKPPLKIRFRKEGDRFIPLGQEREKKIGKFLTSQHVPEEIRRKTLIIADAERIIWLYPIRVSAQTKITERTKKIIQIKIVEQPI